MFTSAAAATWPIVNGMPLTLRFSIQITLCTQVHGQEGVRAVPTGHHDAHGPVVYWRAHMKVSVIRVISTLLLSGQMLPIGLPLLCDQVQRATPANCDQQMASHPSGPAVDATTHATPCANSAFCAITAPAVVALGAAVSVSAGESHIVVSGVSTFAPADPQAPLPPPPQA